MVIEILLQKNYEKLLECRMLDSKHHSVLTRSSRLGILEENNILLHIPNASLLF